MKTTDMILVGALALGGAYALGKLPSLPSAGLTLQPSLDALDAMLAQLQPLVEEQKRRTTPVPLFREELGIGELAEAERLGQGFSEFVENVKRNWASGGSMGL